MVPGQEWSIVSDASFCRYQCRWRQLKPEDTTVMDWKACEGPVNRSSSGFE